MESTSYQTLHNCIQKLLPECLTKGTLIKDHLSNTFDPRLVNFNPYKEIMPTYYSWHKKTDKASDCIVKGGPMHTARLLHYIQKNMEQHLLPDLIIATCSHDLLYLGSHMEESLRIDLTAFKEWEEIAKKKLKDEEYPLWHHSYKTYLPEMPDEMLSWETLKLPELASNLVTIFLLAFGISMIYHGYTESCYKKAEDYKISHTANFY